MTYAGTVRMMMRLRTRFDAGFGAFAFIDRQRQRGERFRSLVKTLAAGDPVLNAGVRRFLGRCGDRGPDRIQIDIRHARHHGLRIEQRDRLEARFPEVAGAIVLAIRSACDGLFDRLHEPGDGFETVARHGDPFGIAGIFEDFRFAPFTRRAIASGTRMAQRPASSHLMRAPRFHPARSGPHRQMKMVLHKRIRKHIDRERSRTVADELAQPFLPMRSRSSTQKRPPHAAADQVVGGGHIVVDDQRTGYGHDGGIYRAVIDPCQHERRGIGQDSR